MASGNSNNLNNNKGNIKLKFTGENAKADAELELDDFKIDDISFEVKQNAKAEESDENNTLTSDHEELDTEDSNGTNEVSSQDGFDDEMQDISDDEDDNESKDDADDDNTENSDDDEDGDAENSDDDEDGNTENSDDNKRKKDDNNGSDDASPSDGTDDKKDGDSKEPDGNKQENSDEDKKPDEKGNDEQPKDDKKDENSNDSGGNKQENDGEDKKNNNDQSKENDDKKNNDKQSKDPKDKKDNGDNKPEQDNNKKNDQKNNNAGKKDSPSNQSKQNSNRNRPPKGNNNAGRKSFKDRAKQGLKNQVNQGFNNSKLGETINKGKDAVEKGKKAAEAVAKAGKATAKAIRGLINFFISTFPVSAIVLGIVLLVALIIIVAVIVFPGKIDVNDLYASDNYSEKDNSTLAKLRNIYQKYPNGDAALAMLAVVYPHYQTLQGNEVTYYLESGEKELDPSKVYEDTDEEESRTDDDGDDKSTCEDEECESTASDDMYLELFRKWIYRYKFKKLMKKSNSMSEDDFIKYLRDDYIQSESAYKKLIDIVDDDKKEEFLDAVIEDLKSKKNYFTSYIYENVSCTSSEQSLGTYSSDIIKGQAVIVLKDTHSGTFSDIKAAKSLYGTDDLSLSLKRYAMGVAYSEVGTNVQNEAMAKAEMIAAKSFVLGRTAPGSAKTMGMSFGYDQVDDKTVFYLRGNTYDQDFCDVYEGCRTGRYAKSNVTAGTGEAQINQKDALDSESIEKLSNWYDETMGEFVFDDDTKTFYGTQFSNYGSNCKVGSCMSQTDAINAANTGSTYKEILFDKAYSEDRFTLYDMETQRLATVTVDCNEIVSSTATCGITDNDFIYYSQKVEPYASKYFCGREGSEEDTIEKAGCGITAMAMVISNLTDTKVDPIKANEEAFAGYNNGQNVHCNKENGGTKYSYFKDAAEHYKLTYNAVEKSNSTDINKSAEEMLDTIRKGGLAIIEVNNSWLVGGRNYHFLVAKSIDGEGNLVIADPAAQSINDTASNNGSNHISAVKLLQDYVDNGRSWFMFTGDKSNDIVKKYCVTSSNGYLGNPLDPNDVSRDFMQVPSAGCFPYYCGGGAHSGFDLAEASGTPVYAMDAGTVSYAGTYSGNCYPGCASANAPGLGVSIDHGNNYETGYWHFSKRVVSLGDKVSKGQLIGYVGNTGNSSGAHVHITLKNVKLYRKYGWSGARGRSDRGFMNAAKYINKNVSYVGKTE